MSISHSAVSHYTVDKAGASCLLISQINIYTRTYLHILSLVAVQKFAHNASGMFASIYITVHESRQKNSQILCTRAEFYP